MQKMIWKKEQFVDRVIGWIWSWFIECVVQKEPNTFKKGIIEIICQNSLSEIFGFFYINYCLGWTMTRIFISFMCKNVELWEQWVQRMTKFIYVSTCDR